MLAKNLPANQSFWKIPFRFVLDILSAFKFLLAGNAADFIAVIEAELAFIKWLIFKRKYSVFPQNKSGKLTDGSIRAWCGNILFRVKKLLPKLFKTKADFLIQYIIFAL